MFFKSICISKIIGFCFFILAFLLPIHNSLIVFVVNVLGLPNWLALWKEALVLMLIVFLKIDLVKKIGLKNLRQKYFLFHFFILI
jgi:hypothetical protein